MLDNLGGNKAAGGELKSTNLWDEPNEAASNSSGFSAVAAGFRYYLGKFSFLGKFSGLWSSNEANEDLAWVLFVDRSSNVRLLYYGKKNGYSCRCVMD
jgi:uncharacterized protein (TIGR02145 family)